VGVECPPAIGDDDDLAGGLEFVWDLRSGQPGGIGVPADSLKGIGLTQSLEKPEPLAIRVEIIHVVQNQWATTLLPKLTIDAEGRGIALDPARPLAHRLTEELRLARARAADKDQKAKVAVGEPLNYRFELAVGA